MSALDVTDLAALEAALEALPLGQWVDVVTAGETHRLIRVPGDLTIASGDVVDGAPTTVVVLGDLSGEGPVPLVGERGPTIPATDTDSESLLLLADADPVETAELDDYRRRQGGSPP